MLKKLKSIKSEPMRPFFKEHPIVTFLVALLMLITSPVLMPILVCIHNKDDVVSYYYECLLGLSFPFWRKDVENK